MKIKKMLNGNVAIRPDKPEEQTRGGILLAEQIKTFPPYGRVIAVPDGVTDFEIGDRVQYKVYGSVDIEEDLAIVHVSGVIRVL